MRYIAALAIAASALGACDRGAVPRPSRTPAPPSTSQAQTAPDCKWPASADRNTSTAVVLADAASYYLFDTAGGKMLAQCPLGMDLAVATTQPTDSSADGAGTSTWYGLLLPGGPRHTIVAEPGGALDLASGDRYSVQAKGFKPIAVGETSVLMVDAGATKTAPTEPSAWCVIARTNPGACNRVRGADAPGTPVLSREGAISWAPLTTRSTSVEAGGQRVAVRSDGRTVVAATGKDLAVSALGNGWVDLSTQDEPNQRPTWYVTSSSVTSPTTTTGGATWTAVKRAAGSALSIDPSDLTVSDAAIASGTTSVILVVSATEQSGKGAHPVALVRVGENGSASALGVVTVDDATSDGAPVHIVAIGNAVPAD